MRISEMTGTSHTGNADGNTNKAEDGERDQEDHAQLPVPFFVHRKAGEERETPDCAKDEVNGKEEEEGETDECDCIMRLATEVDILSAGYSMTYCGLP